MSAIAKALAGVVLVVVGVITAPYGGGSLVTLGASLLLSAAAQALGPKPPRAPPLSGIDVAYSGTLEPRRLIYGQLKVSGMNALPPMTSGANNDYFHQIICFAGRAVTAIDDVYFGQIRIPSANIGIIIGGVNDGLVSGIPVPPAGTVNGNGYNAKTWLRRYDGTQSAVDYILNQTFSIWDANHKGQDIAYLAAQFGPFDQATFSSGVPQLTAIVRGHKLYDPRADSTNGGSGSQRYTTPSTWTYSTNPALALRDYLTASLGLSEAQTRIDDTLCAAAAGICDQTVTVPIPVLVGLTNWSLGSAIVTGSNSAFSQALVVNAYVKAPNGSMLQVLSIQSDLQFTLTANYGGANAAGQVTQYNNASNATSVTQSRYTCNTALDCTARFEDNIATLAGAMMGYCIYSSGKWRMYAGAWSGSAFALTEDDLVGGITMQCTTPRKDLFNAVRGNFIDPQQNYQPSEFPPVLNPSYVTQDGGETIYVETNFPCCSDRYEAQRNAILISRQSRNRHIVTGQYGMSAYGVKVWETGTVTIAEIGWINQTVRCTSWKFMPAGVIELTLQEAYSADWTDPSVGDYAITGINVGPPPGEYLPYPPTSLTSFSIPTAIQFTVTLPNQVLPGTVIELWEYTANTPFSSATKVAEGRTNVLVITKRDTITRYYWVRTRGANNQVSATYPAGNGFAAAADLTQTGDVAGNAVSQTLSNFAIGTFPFTIYGIVFSTASSTPLTSTGFSVSITTATGAVGVDITGSVAISLDSTVTSWTVTATVYRDGSAIGTAAVQTFSSGSEVWTAGGGQVYPLVFTFIDPAPSAGSHTYTAMLSGQCTGTGATAGANLTQVSLKVREYRR